MFVSWGKRTSLYAEAFSKWNSSSQSEGSVPVADLGMFQWIGISLKKTHPIPFFLYCQEESGIPKCKYVKQPPYGNNVKPKLVHIGVIYTWRLGTLMEMAYFRLNIFQPALVAPKPDIKTLRQAQTVLVATLNQSFS